MRCVYKAVYTTPASPQYQVGGHCSVSNDWLAVKGRLQEDGALQMVDSKAVAVETEGLEVLHVLGGAQEGWVA